VGTSLGGPAPSSSPSAPLIPGSAARFRVTDLHSTRCQERTIAASSALCAWAAAPTSFTPRPSNPRIVWLHGSAITDIKDTPLRGRFDLAALRGPAITRNRETEWVFPGTGTGASCAPTSTSKVKQLVRFRRNSHVDSRFILPH
jgi:hypothetical protein